MLDRRTDHDVATFRTGDGTTDENYIIIRTDVDNLEILDRLPVVTVTTRHVLVFPNTTRVRSGTNTTRATVHHVTVRLRLSLEVESLHNTLETFTLGCANDVDPLVFFKKLNAGMVALRKLLIAIETKTR